MKSVRVIRPAQAEAGSTGLEYLAGVVAESCGAEQLALQIVRVPPGSRSAAHAHGEHESAAYVLEGEVVTWFGDELGQHVTARQGDFVYIPDGVPHVAANYGECEAVALVARSDSSGQESVEPFPALDELPHLAKPPSGSR
jgi:uncharacterized RmlC-like cupin family protein